MPQPLHPGGGEGDFRVLGFARVFGDAAGAGGVEVGFEFPECYAG